MSILDSINSTKDVKKLNINELNALSEEIRHFLIENVSKTGGHLASNLGVVELTLALHKSFDFPSDKIIFDVGHQSYVHKIITGRKNQFNTLRKLDGLSGFPKLRESEYDFFETGHSSNSLSVAIGMKRASHIANRDNNVIALLGDGSFVGGMVYEAINDAGHNKDNIIVILNDNQMSISENQSSISRYLNKIRLKNSYINAKSKVEKSIVKYKKTTKFLRSFKKNIKRLLYNESLFEELGFKYYGPYDGHNIEELITVFESVNNINSPIIIHVVTKKGKGYSYAEENPIKYHGISKFDINTGENVSKKDDFSKIFGKEIVNIAEKNNKIVCITAAMTTGTGLEEFSYKFPKRFFDVGICEEHAVSMCGGMAKEGCIPVVPIYSSFLQRAYDQIITDVALMNLHVVFIVDRAGIVGEDGETHQGIFDISYLRSIPNMTVLSPSSFEEFKYMLNFGIDEIKGPVAIRIPKGEEWSKTIEVSEIEWCKAKKLSSGKNVTIVTEGRMTAVGEKVSLLLRELNVEAEHINLRFIKPIDYDTIKQSVIKTKRLIILEESIKSGGIGESIIEELSGIDVKIYHKYIEDKFIEHGSVDELFERYGLDAQSVITGAKEVFDF